MQTSSVSLLRKVSHRALFGSLGLGQAMVRALLAVSGEYRHRLAELAVARYHQYFTALSAIRYERARFYEVPTRLGRFKIFIISGWASQHDQFRQSETDPTKEYEPVMSELISRIVRATPEPKFADIGASAGYFCCITNLVSGGKAECLAVEGNAAHFSGLLKTLEGNGITNVKSRNVILSDSDAGQYHSGALYMDYAHSREAKSAATPVLTFDTLCKEENFAPNIAKVDVDGADASVLAGMKNTLANSISWLLFEVSAETRIAERSNGKDRDFMLALLLQLGFKLFYVSGHRHKLSAGLRSFAETGKIDAIPILSPRDPVLFDRHIDFLLLAVSPKITEDQVANVLAGH